MVLFSVFFVRSPGLIKSLQLIQKMVFGGFNPAPETAAGQPAQQIEASHRQGAVYNEV
jgi:hypothetical protein